MKKPRVMTACVLSMVLVTGCSGSNGFSLYDAPLPGGASVGNHPYRVVAQFSDVLDLVPQSSVKVNGVPVGRVDSIGLSADNKDAAVTMVINGDVVLPANATASLLQSSLLGEKYVELAAPTGVPPQGRLTNGATIPLDRTNRNPEVEEVLGALSLLLNGGGVDQIHTIVTQLNSALSGNEEQLRSLLTTITDVASKLDAQKANITNAIDGLNRLSGTLATQTNNISTALNNLGPGIQVINQERSQLVTMLESLNQLSTVSVQTINQSRAGMIADLQALTPILNNLAKTGTSLPTAISYLASYPYPQSSLNDLKGDYFNSDIRLDLDLSDVVNNLVLNASQLPVSIPGVNDGDQGDPGAPSPVPAPPAKPAPGSPPLGLNGVVNTLLGGH